MLKGFIDHLAAQIIAALKAFLREELAKLKPHD